MFWKKKFLILPMLSFNMLYTKRRKGKFSFVWKPRFTAWINWKGTSWIFNTICSYFLFSFKFYRIFILGCVAHMLLRIYAMYLICYSLNFLVNDSHDKSKVKCCSTTAHHCHKHEYIAIKMCKPIHLCKSNYCT